MLMKMWSGVQILAALGMMVNVITCGYTIVTQTVAHAGQFRWATLVAFLALLPYAIGFASGPLALFGAMRIFGNRGIETAYKMCVAGFGCHLVFTIAFPFINGGYISSLTMLLWNLLVAAISLYAISGMRHILKTHQAPSENLSVPHSSS